MSTSLGGWNDARRGRVLHMLRAATGMERQEMAAALGVSAAYVTLLENGKRPITAALCARLAVVLRLGDYWLDAFESDIAANIGRLLLNHLDSWALHPYVHRPVAGSAAPEDPA